ncbi:MAG: DUF1499 domain-containing protein [Salinisphaera sp.]|nr:DUF1499 domain-containing protein [Salinisphaera sp.]
MDKALVCLLLLLTGCAAAPPDTLRGLSGTLAPCPGAPRCVSSRAEDPEKRVPPLRFAGSPAQQRRALAAVVQSMDGGEVITAKGDYVHATFTSDWFGFVDDVEFVLTGSEIIHVRSSSRIGYYDFGVNRARVEEIRDRLRQHTNSQAAREAVCLSCASGARANSR